MSKRLRLEIFGPLRLIAPDGSDLTPRSAKAQGVLALLATGAGRTRSRPWLKERLWSDRSKEQGAASLRQVLSDLRKCLGAHAGCLVADRQRVALDPARVAVAERSSREAEFAEGIEIRDPAFLDWLRAERSGQGGAPAPVPARPRRRLLMTGTPARPGMEGFFADAFADMVARSLDDLTGLAILRRPVPGIEPDLVLRTVAAAHRGVAQLRVTLDCPRSGLTLWSASDLVEMRGAPPLDHRDVLRLVHAAATRVAEADAAGGSAGAGVAGADGDLRRIFSLRPDRIRMAMRAQIADDRREPAGLAAARQVFLHIAGLIADVPTALPGARTLMREALDAAPRNATVLAIAGQCASILDGDPATGWSLARRALRANGADPLAWDSLAVAALFRDRPDTARSALRMARHIAGTTPILDWLEPVAALSPHLGAALAEAEDWSRRRSAPPTAHPRLRALCALCLHGDRFDTARSLARMLTRPGPGIRLIPSAPGPADRACA